MLVNGVVPITTVVSSPDSVSVQPRAFIGAKNTIVPRSFPMQTADAKAESWRQYDEMANSISGKLGTVVKGFVTEFENETFDALESGTGVQETSGLNAEQSAKLAKVVDDATNQVTQKVLKDFGLGKEDLSGELGQQLQQMSRDLNSQIVSSINDSMDLIKQDVIETISQKINKNRLILTWFIDF